MANDHTSKFSLFMKKRRRLPSPVVLLIALVIRILRLTYRVKIIDRAGLMTPERPWPVILLLWHNRLLFTSCFFPKRLRRQTAALTSASRDGQYVADFLGQFQITAVRGSSSRGGREALRDMRRQLLQENRAVAITPDGPRGPRYQLHIGPVLLAEMTKVPLVPASFNAPKRWEIRGWDRTQIPKPFSRVEFIIGEPILIDRKLTPEERETTQKNVEAALMAVTDDQ